MKNCGFTRKILDDFHDFVSECVSFPRKINNPFWEVTVFRGKVSIFIGREAKTHILPTKINEKIAKVSRSKNNSSFRIMITIQQQQQQRSVAILAQGV